MTDYSHLNRKEKLELIKLKTEKLHRLKTTKIYRMYPESGPLSISKYPKHRLFMAVGKKYKERAIIAANRVGKTEGIGGYELVCHLTGIYPDWWEGHRFDYAIKAWAAGTTNQKTKEILQEKLLGPLTEVGTGLIPGDLIADYKKKASSVPDVVETILVKHISGEISTLVLKSYEQKRIAFEGTEQDFILLDEEPPPDIYEECTLRTMTTDGLIALTFTPLRGVSTVVLKFMPGGTPMDGPVVDPETGKPGGKFLVTATWDDAPHLDSEAKARLWASLPPHQRDARAKGIPSLGSGAIYPIPEPDITIKDFPIPPYWPKVYAMDFGWNNTAVVWFAYDRENDILYTTSCYKRGQEKPPVHTAAIRSRGPWIPGCCDPAGDRNRNQDDGKKLLDLYRKSGLKLQVADNAREAGIYDVWTRMVEGRFKVFASCVEWFEEYRLYHRDKDGKIVKENDHLMDCTRYGVRTGIKIAIPMPVRNLATEMGIPLESGGGYDPLRHGLQ